MSSCEIKTERSELMHIKWNLNEFAGRLVQPLGLHAHTSAAFFCSFKADMISHWQLRHLAALHCESLSVWCLVDKLSGSLTCFFTIGSSGFFFGHPNLFLTRQTSFNFVTIDQSSKLEMNEGHYRWLFERNLFIFIPQEM